VGDELDAAPATALLRSLLNLSLNKLLNTKTKTEGTYEADVTSEKLASG